MELGSQMLRKIKEERRKLVRKLIRGQNTRSPGVEQGSQGTLPLATFSLRAF